MLDRIEEIDGMALAGAPGGTILMQEYKERLQKIEGQMQAQIVPKDETSTEARPINFSHSLNRNFR